MVAVSSTMLPLGTPAPDFQLPDTDGKMVALSDLRDARALLVMFICNHCPYVKHIRSGLAAFAHDYQARGLAIVAINANDVTTHPDDSPEKMAAEKREAGYNLPLSLRRDPGGREGLSRRLHTGLLLVRRQSPSGLPRAV